MSNAPSSTTWWTRLLVVAAALAAAACAQEGMPPGGPVDETPPDLVEVRPGSLAVAVDPQAPLVFVFSEKVDRSGFRSGLLLAPPQRLRSLSFDGEAVMVRPERPWPADSVVVWTLLPTLTDRHRVPLGRPVSGAFTTGDSLPEGAVKGQAVGEELTLEKVVASLRVPPPEGQRGAIPWRLGAVNEIGVFRLAPLDVPSGPYEVEVFQDANGNGRRDEREPVARRDSLFLAEGVRILDLGPLELIDLEAPVELRICVERDPSDTVDVWISLEAVGVEDARTSKLAVDSLGCASTRLRPGEYRVGAWRDRDGDGAFGPGEGGRSEPFRAALPVGVVPARPDTLLLGAVDSTLAWDVLDTLRTPPVPRGLFPGDSP